MTKPQEDELVCTKKMSKVIPLIFGGISGMSATTTIQPIDTVKVRIQILSESGAKNKNPFNVARGIIKNEGYRGFYKGLDSALFRQLTYGSIRIGLFKQMYRTREEAHGGKNPPLYEKIGCALTWGILASFVGNPSDVALVRFQSDSALPVDQRRNYKHVFDAFRRIVKEEGAITLWRGLNTNMGRAISLTVGQMASFEEIKQRVIQLRGGKEGLLTTSIASAGAGMICACTALPFDNMRTKLQKMKKLPDGTMPYSGLADCFKKTLKKEGATGFWVGLPTFITRVAPHTIVSLLVMDSLLSYFDSHQPRKWSETDEKSEKYK